jgi:gliding motility-associated-like protein
MAQCDSIVSFIDATATDNCGIASIVRLDNTGLNSGDEFPIGITTISYLVTDVNNNEDSCSFEIEVYAPPVANAGEDLVTRDIQPIVIEASSTNGVSFRWTPAFSVAIDTAEQPIVNPQETTTYTMEVTTAEGCIVTDEVTVTVNVVTKLDATTLFSPNGDGMNDTWVVNKPALIDGCKLIIVNRNGSEVYSTSQYNNEWDGTVNGTQLPEGTYYYIFDCPDGRTLNGPITILRERR